MIIEHSQLENFLTNTYLVADREGGSAVLVDAGGPMEPLLARIDELGVTLTHVLLTHHHYDHIVELDKVVAEHPGVPVLIHPLERELVPQATGELQSGETVTSGDLSIEALHTPGHTAGMLALVANGSDVFTGDTLFKGSVGGVRAPGSTSFADLHSSVMDRLMGLDHETVVHPGHTDPTTIGAEWETNAFIRVWRGLDREGSEPCVALGEPATLVLWAPDYDGGHKAWVRWADGRDDIVPGSQVQRGEE
jgi:glyoxylase-like metal-dependent hydrolase (beta-lactamase superfamily II)